MADDAESVVKKCGWSGACVVCALSDVNELTLIDCLGGEREFKELVNLLFCLIDNNPCRFVSGEDDRWYIEINLYLSGFYGKSNSPNNEGLSCQKWLVD